MAGNYRLWFCLLQIVYGVDSRAGQEFGFSILAPGDRPGGLGFDWSLDDIRLWIIYVRLSLKNHLWQLNYLSTKSG